MIYEVYKIISYNASLSTPTLTNYTILTCSNYINKPILSSNIHSHIASLAMQALALLTASMSNQNYLA